MQRDRFKFFLYMAEVYITTRQLYIPLYISKDDSSISWKSERSEIQSLLVQAHCVLFKNFPLLVSSLQVKTEADESNRVYWFETRFLYLVYSKVVYIVKVQL